jgi:hypothetical protein
LFSSIFSMIEMHWHEPGVPGTPFPLPVWVGVVFEAGRFPDVEDSEVGVGMAKASVGEMCVRDP